MEFIAGLAHNELMCMRRIGASLLKGDWQGAIDLIMKPHDDDREDNAAPRRLYSDKGDLRGALRAMPKHLTAEKAILEVLRLSHRSPACSIACTALPCLDSHHALRVVSFVLPGS